MEPIRPKKSVHAIIAFRKDEQGRTVPVTLWESPSRKRRKGSPPFRPAEKLARRWAEAQRAAAEGYLARHERSNEKKKDGWARDLAYNLAKASDKGRKKLKVLRLPL